MKRAAGILLIVLTASGVANGEGPSATEPPNVVLVIVDDMNDWVGTFGGNPQAITPHMDSLANRGIVFRNAYCSAPLCNPSRTSMLTGYLPSTTGVYGNTLHFREVEGFEQTVTLPQYFSRHGYITRAAGKIFHNPRGPATEPKPMSDPGSFQKEHKGNIGTIYPDDRHRFLHGLELDQPGIHSHFQRTFDWYGLAQRLEETHDWRSAEYCARFLKEKHDRPFFLACGIFRPHLPWFAPAEYFELYDLDQIILPEVINDDLDDLGPMAARMSQVKLHREVLSKGKWKEAVRAYLANLSYADACVGHVLNALDESGYGGNTIVVLMGDHGYHLGEKEHWSKNVLWEESAKTPLIIYDPRTGETGICERTVSLIDIYPTLLELCGLPKKADLDGVSLQSLVEDPGAVWDRPALTTRAEGIHSLRSTQYRYISYSDGSEELYDHNKDPMEWNNLADDPSARNIIQSFRKELKLRIN